MARDTNRRTRVPKGNPRDREVPESPQGSPRRPAQASWGRKAPRLPSRHPRPVAPSRRFSRGADGAWATARAALPPKASGGERCPLQKLTVDEAVAEFYKILEAELGPATPRHRAAGAAETPAEAEARHFRLAAVAAAARLPRSYALRRSALPPERSLPAFRRPARATTGPTGTASDPTHTRRCRAAARHLGIDEQRSRGVTWPQPAQCGWRLIAPTPRAGGRCCGCAYGTARASSRSASLAGPAPSATARSKTSR